MDILPVANKATLIKRYSELSFIISVISLAFYAVVTLNPTEAGLSLIAIMGGVALGLNLIASVVLRFSKSPQNYTITISQLLLLAGTSALISGGATEGLFFVLWALSITITSLISLLPSALVVFILTAISIYRGYPLAWPPDTSLITEILIYLLALIIGVLLHRTITETSGPTHARHSSDYKKPPAEITRLIDHSSDLINALGDGILAIDSQEIVQLINPTAEKILGWKKSDVINLQYQSVLKIADETGAELTDNDNPIKQTLNTNQESRSRSLQLTTKNDKKLFVSLTVSPLGAPGSGVIAILRDVTKERAEEREQAEFISTASHEMRTPVASIEGFLGLAMNPNTAQVDERAREYIEKAHESAKHLGRLFQDLLDVSRAEDGRLVNRPVVFDIIDFGAHVIDGLTHSAHKKGLRLIFKPASAQGDKGEKKLKPVLYVNLDKDHVRELISNLTENAIKYTLQGGVEIDIVGAESTVTISIKDSGVGIPDEDIPHLFQKFYRVDNTDTREIGGTGLGLFLCRRLAETLGGRIWVESTYQKGSTFFVELPRIDTITAQQLLEKQAQEQKEEALKAAQIASQQPPMPISTAPQAPLPTQAQPVPTPISQPATQQSQPIAAPTHAAPQQHTATPQPPQYAAAAPQPQLQATPQAPQQPIAYQQTQAAPIPQPVQPAPSPQPQPAQVNPPVYASVTPTQPPTYPSANHQNPEGYGNNNQGNI